jgi:hypothetical protein
MDLQVARISGTASNGSSTGTAVAHIAAVFFTGPVLAIVAIVACGKWLGMLFVLPRAQNDSFGPRIPGFMSFVAKGHEALLGLTAFILTVAVFGLTIRDHIGPFVKSDFGLDIGQFVSLCFVSSLTILALALLTVATKGVISLPVFHRNSLVAEQRRRIEGLPGERGGGRRGN